MKLSDCVRKSPSQVELLLVFSEAAYEAAKIDRDRLTQALLPISQAFILEDELIDVLDNNDCQSLIAAIGVGVAQRTFDITKARYGKIILVTQQGELARRASNEVLRFFFKYMRPLIDGGHLFVLETPLEAEFTQSEFVEQVLNTATRRLSSVCSEDDLETPLERRMSS